jgi:hypothetical protein
MNIVLDKVQGPFLMLPEWVVPIHYLMREVPHAAFQRAYAGIITEMERLYRAVQVSTGDAEAPRDAGRVAVF